MYRLQSSTIEFVSVCPAVLVPPPLGVIEIDRCDLSERSLTTCATPEFDFGDITTCGMRCHIELSFDAIAREDSSVEVSPSKPLASKPSKKRLTSGVVLVSRDNRGSIPPT
jgi:hypothetical protein